MADTRKIGRDARTGEFIPVREAERRKNTAVVETIKKGPKPAPKKGGGKGVSEWCGSPTGSPPISEREREQVNAKAVIRKIRIAVENIQNQNHSVVSADALLAYLTALEDDVENAHQIDEKKFESDMAVFRAQHESNLAHYEAQQTHAVEMLRSVFSYGQAALKSAILINGGAAAALLALIGNIWSKEIAPDAVGSITSSVVLFSFGVLSAAVGTAGSYFSQYCYSQELSKTGIAFHTLTVALVFLSYLLFGLGALQAYYAFVEHLAP